MVRTIWSSRLARSWFVAFGCSMLLLLIISGLSHLKEPIYGYYVRDYLRGDSVLVVRLPETQGSYGLITITEQRILETDRHTTVILSDKDFTTLMQFRSTWCQKLSNVLTHADQTPNYIIGVRCDNRMPRQFEVSQEALPNDIGYLLTLAGMVKSK